MVAFEVVHRRTLFGKLGTAISSDPEMAAALGANVTSHAVLAFAVGGLLAGSAGVLVGPISFANPYLGETYGIYGFIALMIGGIERPAASMGGGFVLGHLGHPGQHLYKPASVGLVPFRGCARRAARDPERDLRVRWSSEAAPRAVAA